MPQFAFDMTKVKHPIIGMVCPVATRILGVAVSTGLSGCAGFYQQYRDFQDGWRTGEIVQISRASEIQRSGRTYCRKTASSNELELHRFAILVDRSTGQRHAHIVMLNPATSVELGDIVSTNVVKCGTPIRVLSHAQAPRE
ncbi:TPA: hypothetical protein ACVGKB_000288 [Pseudomonas aeruginosa]|jgi:hypothetical protein|uniref:hypothetical protein n=1 Tax=Pseudomonas aeruginosa TaxID=287 RepID=UPI000A8D19D1|nr:hypothetical protein [Pseudomonas aeruginosa]MBI8713336.1 hypothetical protein [Pseudomonas aeruginosa]UGR35319.1 hypothetical protein LSP18_10455 [Pseudomonas aeruginosa]VFT59643.1 Uncharacterised protein [Pseudomonas aeruginosa]HBP0206079.1 hypothetical protein [Pseudomonas aeruginosa]HBP0887426.1 hypothetical protein [Pseudomonas aeruginosa]